MLCYLTPRAFPIGCPAGEVVQGKLRPQQHLTLSLPQQHDALSFFAAAEAAAAAAPSASDAPRCRRRVVPQTAARMPGGCRLQVPPLH